MSDPLRLARPEILGLRPYTPAAYEPGLTRLNANESPWRMPGDRTERGLNIYPPPRPEELRRRLAAHYGASDDELLVTRGSSESIDALIRGFCAAGRDAILVMPPVFDMYRVYAGIQNANVVEVPLLEDGAGSLDLSGVLAATDTTVHLVFICTPNNPTGQSIDREHVAALCEQLTDRAIVVIDEAYHEFADAPDFLAMRQKYRNVVLLRTLSKFVSLAGARCGAMIADA
jgi:histidinol-phosphate aminotransferase